jgi:hypothetical protein
VKKRTKNDEELYHNCWLSNWKNNHADPKQWVEISCVTFFFLAKSDIPVYSMLNINATHASKEKINFDATNNNSCAL